MKRFICCLAATAALSACVDYSQSTPVLFGQSQSVGINIGLSQVSRSTRCGWCGAAP